MFPSPVHRSFMPSSFLCLSLLLQLVPVDSQIRLGLVGWDCFHPHGWSWVPCPLSLLCASRWSGNVFRSPGSDWVGTGAGQTAGRLTPGSSHPGGAQRRRSSRMLMLLFLRLSLALCLSVSLGPFERWLSFTLVLS